MATDWHKRPLEGRAENISENCDTDDTEITSIARLSRIAFRLN